LRQDECGARGYRIEKSSNGERDRFTPLSPARPPSSFLANDGYKTFICTFPPNPDN